MTQPEFQHEAERARYALRSSFFYRIHTTWLNLLHMVELATKLVVDWQEHREFGVSDSAWKQVQRGKVNPILVFCHPDVIMATPPLVTYYRCLALLPQKGAQRLICSILRYEDGSKSHLPQRQARQLSQTFNSLISLLIESDPKWTLDKARIAALLNFGTQVNGSWRNEIGAEGGRRVKELLVSHLVGKGLVASAERTDGSLVKGRALTSVAETSPIEAIKSFKTKGGYTFMFGSEPDVAILNAGGVLISTIEIKYGLDPAGALERYGAAKKSFEQATKENRRVHNIYLASCLTPEVRRRIDEDRLVNEDFNLTEVLADANKRGEFLKRIEHLISL